MSGIQKALNKWKPLILAQKLALKINNSLIPFSLIQSCPFSKRQWKLNVFIKTTISSLAHFVYDVLCTVQLSFIIILCVVVIVHQLDYMTLDDKDHLVPSYIFLGISVEYIVGIQKDKQVYDYAILKCFSGNLVPPWI